MVRPYFSLQLILSWALIDISKSKVGVLGKRQTGVTKINGNDELLRTLTDGVMSS